MVFAYTEFFSGSCCLVAMNFNFPAIGVVHSCFKEKFGIPRQPGLVPLAKAELEILAPFNNPAAFDGLETTSHIWLQFVFHENARETWKPKVKPPRLGGNHSLGVFATRSPIRPAAIGLSVVKLDGIDYSNGKLVLAISGVDLLDGTPVLDIKPYIPYVDAIPEAINYFAGAAPPVVVVEFKDEILEFCVDYQQKTLVDVENLIRQVLQQDPRPAYQQPDSERLYGMKLLDLDIGWSYKSRDGSYHIHVHRIRPL